MKLFSKIEEGYFITIPEAAASMTIMSVVLLSLMYITGEAYYYFNRELMREDVQHYSNTVLDEIADMIYSAPEVDMGNDHNSETIQCYYPESTIVYSADKELGVLKDGEPLDFLRFNKSKTLPYKMELMEFDCSYGFHITETTDEDLRESFYKIELVIDALFNKNDIELRQQFKFSRSVFARSNFARI